LTTVGPVNTFSHVEPLDHLMMLGACSVAVKVPVGFQNSATSSELGF
jgi:hypothetical protein